MYRLSLIISEIYNKYLPLAEQDGIVLNLDFSDTTKEISDPDRIKQFLDEHLDSTLKRSDRGEVTIGVDHEAITITDTATVLSPTACALLSNRFISVTSRVGFGTTIRIFLQPRDLPEDTTSHPELSVEGASFAIAADRSSDAPTLDTAVKLKAKDQRHPKRQLQLSTSLHLKGKTKSVQKTAKTDKKSLTKAATQTKRELSAAAKKANREVKRIAKKAEKQAKKISKQSQKAAKSTGRKPHQASTKAKSSATKTVKKTKRKLKLS